jgi:SAM-dependent methyltransferase
MTLSLALPRLLAALGIALVAISSTVSAQSAREYEPRVGQEGKDVVWVPTSQALVDKMLDMAKMTPSDYVIDLGSGDGRTVITAAKRGAKAHGIEYNPDMVALSKRNAEKAGVADKATFANADIFQSDFSSATVLTLFLLTDLNIKLRPTILDMKPGTRVVSNSFTMGDWTPEETAVVSEGCTSFCRAHFWIVPAKVDGTWQLGQSQLTIEQKYQNFTGRLATGNVVAPIANGKLSGEQITFTAGGAEYAGRVSGSAMEGTAKSGGTEAKWQATRTK